MRKIGVKSFAEKYLIDDFSLQMKPIFYTGDGGIVFGCCGGSVPGPGVGVISGFGMDGSCGRPGVGGEFGAGGAG